MPLKYNPLLKFNLQEETDAEKILGDGYNEKLLSWNDFINDINNNLIDNYEERKYLFTSTAQLNGKNINYSCILNFYTTTTFNPSNLFFKGLITKILSINFQRINFWGINFSSKFIMIKNININGNTITLNSDCQVIIHNCIFSSINDFTINCNNHYIVINLFNCTKTNNININITNCSNTSFICDGSIKIVGNTKNYINIDSALDINSRGLLPNSVITAALNNLQPDSTLDEDSTKAIQNKAVTEAINTINQSIGSVTNKVSKFLSADDQLIDNEIAQYQGDDDADNNLKRGFFYTKGQGWQKVPGSTQQTFTVNQLWRVTDYQSVDTDFYDLGTIYLINNMYHIWHTTDNSIYIYGVTNLLNTDLNTFDYDNKTYYLYPFVKVNGVMDFDNEIEVINGNIYYQGNLLALSGSGSGGFVYGEKLCNLDKDTLYLSAFQSNAPLLFEIDSNNNMLIATPLKNSFIQNETTVSVTTETVTITDYELQAGAAGFELVQVQDLTQLNNLIAAMNTFTTDTYTNDHSTETPPYVVTCQVIKNQFLAQVNVIITAGTTVPSGTQLNDIGITLKDDFYINSNIVITAAGKLITNSALSSGIYSATVILN